MWFGRPYREKVFSMVREARLLLVYSTAEDRGGGERPSVTNVSEFSRIGGNRPEKRPLPSSSGSIFTVTA